MRRSILFIFFVFIATKGSFAAGTLEPAGGLFTTGKDDRTDVDYYGYKLSSLPSIPVIEIIPLEGDARFNPQSDQHSDQKWQEKKIGRSFGTISHNLRYRGYRNSGWGGDLNSPAGAYLQYVFRPGDNKIPDLKPGRYILKAQFVYINGLPTRGKCRVNGKPVGGWDKPQADRDLANTFISDPFTYDPAGSGDELSLLFENLGGDRLRLSYVAIVPYEKAALEDSATVRLENDQKLLLFSREGGFLGAYLKEAGLWFQDSEPVAHPPFLLQYLNRGNGAPDSFRFKDYQKTEHADGQTLKFAYEIDAGGGLVEYRVELGAGLDARWTISVENHSRVPVVEVTFPVLGNLRIGETERDNTLLFPRQLGERIPDPVHQTPYQQTNYIGEASMPWMSLFNEQGGLYVGSHDRTVLDTRLEYLGLNTSSMLMFTKQPTIEPGESWTSEPFLVALYEGSWHRAADIYRDWANQWITPMELPRWLRYPTPRVSSMRQQTLLYWTTEPAYHNTHLPEKFEIRHRYTEIPGIWERNLSDQMAQVIWIAGQMIRGGCYRYYALKPQLGTESEWKEAIGDVVKKGGIVQAYTNAMNFDARFPGNLPEEYHGLIKKSVPGVAEADEWPQWVEENSYRSFDGSNRVQYQMPESPYAVEHRIMCPYTEGWQEYMTYWVVDQYVREYGAGVIQIDQLACTFWGTCYNRDHGHKDHGSTSRGYVELVRGIYEEAVRINSDFVLFPEGVADVLAPYVALQGGQANHWTPAEHRFTHMYRYTFPDHTLRWLYFRDYRDQKYSMLMGVGPLHGHAGSREDKLYGEIREFYKDSHFRDTVGLGALPDGVTGSVLEHPENDTLIVMVADRRDDPIEYSITLDKSVYPQLKGFDFVYWYPYENEMNRETVDVTRESQSITFQVPASRSVREHRYHFGALVFAEKPFLRLSVKQPEEAFINELFELNVTAGGVAVENAEVLIGNQPHKTDENGRITTTLEGTDGKYLLRAWKKGYVGDDQVMDLKIRE